MLKLLGSSRIDPYHIKTIMGKMYPSLIMSDILIRRIRKKGMKEHVGKDDDATMVQFLDVGMKWKAVGGSFLVKTSHSQLYYYGVDKHL